MVNESCESLHGHLVDLVDGNVDRDVEGWLRSHIIECPACTRNLYALREAMTQLPDAVPTSPPKYLRKSVLQYARRLAPAKLTAPVGHLSNVRGQWLAVVGILGVVIAALIVGLRSQPATRAVAPGVAAPNFMATNVATGDTLTLSDYRGNVVLLNIWATWCLPCEDEMASMERLYNDFAARGLRVVAVSVDQAGSSFVREWARQRNLTFDVLHDRSGLIERQFQTIGVPETFVIDRNGVIVNRHIGPAQWDDPEHEEFVRNLIGADD